MSQRLLLIGLGDGGDSETKVAKVFWFFSSKKNNFAWLALSIA
jgi:hypothetical protein